MPIGFRSAVAGVALAFAGTTRRAARKFPRVAGMFLLLPCLLVPSPAAAVPLLNSANGHYYDYVPYGPGSSVSWQSAFALADASSYLGAQGYLATITSASEQAFIESLLAGYTFPSGFVNVAIGGSDSVQEGVWRWVAGPEAGTQFWQGGTGGTPVGGSFAFWETVGGVRRQPDSDDYLAIEVNSGAPNRISDYRYQWNDHSGVSMYGYIVEYGNVNFVPEPGSGSLLLLGLAAAVAGRRARTRSGARCSRPRAAAHRAVQKPCRSRLTPRAAANQASLVASSTTR